MAAEVDLNFLAHQNERLINDVASIRDSIDVLTAMVLRLESSDTAILSELRAMQRSFARMNDRVSKLEEEEDR